MLSISDRRHGDDWHKITEGWTDAEAGVSAMTNWLTPDASEPSASPQDARHRSARK